MTILIGALDFHGPIRGTNHLLDESGVFAVLSRTKGEYELIELGQSDRVRSFFLNAASKETWNHLDISVAVRYTPSLDSSQRNELINALEREFDIDAAA